MDAWAAGTLLVLIAYVVVVVVGLVIGRRPSPVSEQSAALLIVDGPGHSAAEVSRVIEHARQLRIPVLVVDTGAGSAGALVRNLERNRQQVNLVRAGPNQLTGVRWLCELAGGTSIASLMCIGCEGDFSE